MTNGVQARGIRNNNPGNLRRSSDPWQGLSQYQTDQAFFKFDSPIYGVRALARTLITYQDKYKLRSINQIIGRWAPPAENDTTAYIASVCKRTGFAANTPLDMHKFDDLKAVTLAIIWHENGAQPYNEAQITKALVLAGVEPEAAPLQQTRTIKGGKAAVVATSGAGLIEVITVTLDPAREAFVTLSPYLDIARWLLLIITLVSVGLMIWARIDDRQKGLR